MSGGSDRASMGARRPGPGRPPAAVAHARFGAVEMQNASASGLRGSRGSLEDEVRCEEGAQKRLPGWVGFWVPPSADGVCGCRTLILKRSAATSERASPRPRDTARRVSITQNDRRRREFVLDTADR